MQGALDKQSLLPGVVWNTTTLGRWNSGYHSFQLRVSKLVLVELLNHDAAHHLRCAFRTGDPVTRREYVLVASTKTSLFSTVTVPPVPGNEVYVCGHFRCCKLLNINRIAPIPHCVAEEHTGHPKHFLSSKEARCRGRL